MFKGGFPQNNTPFEWVSFLTEEAGEFATAINDAFAGKNPSRDVARAIKEATHVSAVALAFIEHYASEMYDHRLKHLPPQMVKMYLAMRQQILLRKKGENV